MSVTVLGSIPLGLVGLLLSAFRLLLVRTFVVSSHSALALLLHRTVAYSTRSLSVTYMHRASTGIRKYTFEDSKQCAVARTGGPLQRAQYDVSLVGLDFLATAIYQSQ